jgi:protein tyrosine phosphatase
VAKSGCLSNGKESTPKVPLSTDKTLAMIREKLNTPQAIDAEFATIPVKRLSAGVSTSQFPHNQERNRRNNVFPYEDTRVMIRPNKRNPDGYINASNVQLNIGNKTLRYIVCQSPLKSHLDDFWQMIWEAGSEIIVCLVNPHKVSVLTHILGPYI